MGEIAEKYKSIVCGYLRMSQILLTNTDFLHLIPIDVISYIILTYYHCIEYKWDLYDETLWRVFDDWTSIQGTRNYLSTHGTGTGNGYMLYPIRISSKTNQDNHKLSIEYWSVKAITTHHSRCHAIGVTTIRKKNLILRTYHRPTGAVTENISNVWGKEGGYSYLDGRSGNWRERETITIALDHTNWSVIYYLTDRKDSYKIKQVKQDRLTPNKKYYFVLCAHTDAAYIGNAQYQIVETPLELYQGLKL